MARVKRNGNNHLDEAMAALTKAHASLAQAQAVLVENQAMMNQTQTAFLARLAATDAQIAETNRQIAETNRINSERFARIEAILMEQSRILLALPDAVREKIGFRSPEPRPAE
jgi:phage-related tail protein